MSLVPALLLEILTGFGSVSALLGAAAVHRFVSGERSLPPAHPPVTVMKPLSGDEPLLEAALATMCEQTYPTYQIVFGVQDPNDPAIATVARLRARFPDRDIALVVGAPSTGPNHKVCNLIGMLPAARHDILVFSDSDMHVEPSYLENVVATLLRPGVGLVTTLYVGRPTVPGLTARLGATQITHSFLPGVLLSRALGRQDCLGTTMALQRDTLTRIGGLAVLVEHLADDNWLGQLVRRLGLSVALAETIPATGVADRSAAMLWQHELRWIRTIRGLEPVALAASILQFSLFWAMLAVPVSGFSAWSGIALISAWVVRAVAAAWIDSSLRLGADIRCAASLLPLRDLVSAAEILASFLSKHVVWRGHDMLADRAGGLVSM